MLKWIGFLVLLGISVSIFIFAPMGLVGRFIALFTPADLSWVGIAFSIGLSLSIVAQSFLARWKSMRPALAALAVLTLSEALMSGGTLYLKALEDGRLDVIVGLGIFAIVVMQEAVLISGGIGMSLVLDRIGDEMRRAEQKATRQAERRSRQSGDKGGQSPETVAPLSPAPATVTTMPASSVTAMSRQARLDAIRRANVARNGAGPMTAAEIVTTFGVSLRQAQRDVAMVAAMDEPVAEVSHAN